MSKESSHIINTKGVEKTRKFLPFLPGVAVVGFLACLTACSAPERKPASAPAKTTQRPAAKRAEAPTSTAKTVAGWEITDFAGHGEVRADGEQIILEMGAFLTGIHHTNSPPKVNYEVSLEAM